MIRHGQSFEKAKHKQSGFQVPETRLHTFRKSKRVWLEMGDNMGHFSDVKLLSFSQHLKSILTLYHPTENEHSGFKAPETRLHTFCQSKRSLVRNGRQYGKCIDECSLEFMSPNDSFVSRKGMLCLQPVFYYFSTDV